MTFNIPPKIYLPPEYDKKSKNPHVRMAIYFDLHIYDDPKERDDTLLYQYLYHIIYMLACTKKYFLSFEDYDAFSLFMATRLYMRYINPEHTKTRGKIKSVLNYCKKLLYPNKVDYMKESFRGIFGTNQKGEIDGSGELYQKSLEENLQNEHCKEDNLTEAIEDEIKRLPQLIRQVVSETPYESDTAIYHRIYISTYMTVLSSLTLSNAAIRRLQLRCVDEEKTKSFLYELEREENPICWRLDVRYANMIRMLTAKVRKRFAERISGMRPSFELSSDDLNFILMSAYDNAANNEAEED